MVNFRQLLLKEYNGENLTHEDIEQIVQEAHRRMEDESFRIFLELTLKESGLKECDLLGYKEIHVLRLVEAIKSPDFDMERCMGEIDEMSVVWLMVAMEWQAKELENEIKELKQIVQESDKRLPLYALHMYEYHYILQETLNDERSCDQHDDPLEKWGLKKVLNTMYIAKRAYLAKLIPDYLKNENNDALDIRKLFKNNTIVKNTLLRHDVAFLWELEGQSVREMVHQWRNFGEKSLVTVLNVCNRHNVKLNVDCHVKLLHRNDPQSFNGALNTCLYNLSSFHDNTIVQFEQLNEKMVDIMIQTGIGQLKIAEIRLDDQAKQAVVMINDKVLEGQLTKMNFGQVVEMTDNLAKLFKSLHRVVNAALKRMHLQDWTVQCKWSSQCKCERK